MTAGSPVPPPLAICSKSAWLPTIRREHSLAMLAAAHGHSVLFIERPRDARSLASASTAREWLQGFRGGVRRATGVPGISLAPHAILLPGHMNGLAETSGNVLLRRELSRLVPGAVTVVNVPWQWPATAGCDGRRVFDCADDWSRLMTHRSARLSKLYRRIGEEADAIVVASTSLAEEFPAERTVVVRNGVSDVMLSPLRPPGEGQRLVHAGTLTPRFDARLASDLLDRLPGWVLDLYGQCQYPGSRERPSPELVRALAAHPRRMRWRGVVAREKLPDVIDSATVALVLNRAERSSGQDSMKLYDYAARGRPIVTTRFSERLEEEGPPNLLVADDADSMVAAILEARQEPASRVAERRRWAEAQRWESRWPAWSTAIFGPAGVPPFPLDPHDEDRLRRQ